MWDKMGYWVLDENDPIGRGTEGVHFGYEFGRLGTMGVTLLSYLSRRFSVRRGSYRYLQLVMQFGLLAPVSQPPNRAGLWDVQFHRNLIEERHVTEFRSWRPSRWNYAPSRDSL